MLCSRQRWQLYINNKKRSRTVECIIYKVVWKKISKISIWNVVCGRIIPQSPSLSAPCWLICTQPGRYVSNSGTKIGLTRCSSNLPFFNVAIYLDMYVLAYFSKMCAWQEELKKIPLQWETTSRLQLVLLSSLVWFGSVVQHFK